MLTEPNVRVLSCSMCDQKQSSHFDVGEPLLSPTGLMSHRYYCGMAVSYMEQNLVFEGSPAWHGKFLIQTQPNKIYESCETYLSVGYNLE